MFVYILATHTSCHIMYYFVNSESEKNTWACMRGWNSKNVVFHSQTDMCHHFYVLKFVGLLSLYLG